MDDSTSSAKEQVRVERERSAAVSQHLQLSKRAIEAERAYRSEMAGNTEAVKKFVATLGSSRGASDSASSGMRNFNKHLDDTERSVKSVSKTLTSFLGILAKTAAYSGGGLIAGGAAGLLGAGGIQGIIGATAALAQFSGALLLLPAVAGGAALALGALTIGTKGFFDALKNMDDPKKFAESIINFAPAMKAAAVGIQQFRDVFRGAQQQIQQSLFAPIVKDIEPLIRSLLPMLTQGLSQVAGVFGQAAHQFAQWLQMPETLKQISGFIGGVVSGLKGLLPALKPFASALMTLATVGAGFFKQLSDSIVAAANSFNGWVQGAAADGSLQRWIQSAITAFQQAWQIIKNVGIALKNVFDAGNSSNLLKTLASMTAEFKAWTESTKGKNTLTEFFTSINTAAKNLTPILKVIGETILGVIVPTLANLGSAISPGILAFFNSFKSALTELGPSLIASAPALNQFLTVLGKLIEVIVAKVGPALPTFFANFATAATNLIGPATDLSGALGTLLSNLSPEAVTAIAGLVVAFQALGAIIPVVRTAMIAFDIVMAANPVGILIAAIAALVVGIIYAYNNFDTFKGYVDGLWSKMKELASWIATVFTNAWTALISSIRNTWNAVTGAVGAAIDTVIALFKALPDKALDWGKNLLKSFAEGIMDSIPGLRSAVDFAASLIPDSWKQNSPAKRGPLSVASTQDMGKGLGDQYAAGIKSTAGAVSDAASITAGGAAANFAKAVGGSTTGPSAGGGNSSGFSQWVHQITGELGMWGDFFQHAFQLATNIGDIFVNTTKVVASLWNKGDNPLTREGGIAGPPSTGQKDIGGFKSAPLPGKAPLPELVPGGQGPAVASIPGTPGANGFFNDPATKPPDAAPATPTAGVGSVNGEIPLKQNPDGTWGSPNPAWDHLIKRESSGRNIPQGITDKNGGPGSPNAAQGLFQITPDTWRRNGGLDFAPNPLAASPEDQAKVAARILRANPSGSDWGAGLPGRESAGDLLAGLGTPAPTAAPGAGGQGGPGAGPGSPNDQVIALNGKGERMTVDRGFAQKYNLQIVGSPSGGPGIKGAAETSGVRWGGDPRSNGVDPKSGNQVGLVDQETNIAQGGGGPGAQRQRRGAPALPAAGIAPAQGNGPTTVNGWSQLQPGQTAPGAFGSQLAPGAPNTILSDFAQWFNANIEPVKDTSSYRSGTPFDKQIRSNHISGTALDLNPNDFPGFSGGRSSGAGAETHFSADQIAKINAQLATYNGAVYWGNNWTGDSKDPMHFEMAGAGYSGGQGGPTNPSVIAAYNRLAGQGGAQGVFGNGTDAITGKPTDVRVVGDSGASIFGNGAAPNGVPINPATGAPLIGPGATLPPNIQGTYDPNKPLIGNATAAAAVPPTIGNATAPGLAPGIDGVPNANANPQAGKSPVDQISSGISAAGTIAGDAFAIFKDVLTNINAVADITDTIVRGFENTQDVMKTIDSIQTFIQTGIDVAKTVGDVGNLVSMVGGATGAADFGGTSAAGAAISAISGIVSSALTAVNAGIDLGQEAYQIASKYGAVFAGYMLGNDQTGALGGNVRMLLNTNTNQLIAYSQDNPDNKAVHNLAPWLANSYGGTKTQPITQQTQLNLYTGPGASPQSLISDTMWLVNTGAPQTASVAGSD